MLILTAKAREPNKWQHKNSCTKYMKYNKHAHSPPQRIQPDLDACHRSQKQQKYVNVTPPRNCAGVTHTLIRTHTHTRARAHTHTHTFIHTHIHTHRSKDRPVSQDCSHRNSSDPLQIQDNQRKKQLETRHFTVSFAEIQQVSLILNAIDSQRSEY